MLVRNLMLHDVTVAITLRREVPQSPKMRKRDRDLAEALRLAGGPPPSLRDRAVALARERGEVCEPAI